GPPPSSASLSHDTDKSQDRHPLCEQEDPLQALEAGSASREKNPVDPTLDGERSSHDLRQQDDPIFMDDNLGPPSDSFDPSSPDSQNNSPARKKIRRKSPSGETSASENNDMEQDLPPSQLQPSKDKGKSTGSNRSRATPRNQAAALGLAGSRTASLAELPPAGGSRSASRRVTGGSARRVSHAKKW
ncbi:hypothetical protein FKP32DRAFT_1682127, partial [Trametes sanguinea]